MKKTTADTQFNFIKEFLEEAGYILVDNTEAGQDIFRKDDIDIIVEVIEHTDNL